MSTTASDTASGTATKTVAVDLGDGAGRAAAARAAAPMTPSPETLGARIQRYRLRQELSVRDLAERSGVNKNTILRLEKGFTPSYATLTRVCEALGIHVAQLTRPEPEEDSVALHSHERQVRVIHSADSAANLRLAAQTADAGRLAFAADEGVLLSVLNCQLPGGKLNAAVLELFAESEPVTHPGEELVFCLQGTADLTVAGRVYTLREGDAVAFWCSERHSYAPAAEASEAGELPVRVLSVWIDAREEAAGK